MSKLYAGLVGFVVAAALAASGVALARGGGGGHGGGGHGGGHFHFGGGHMHFGGGHVGHAHFGGAPHIAHVAHVGALSARAMRGPALRHAFAARGANVLRSPFARAGLTAAVATAAFGPRVHGLWWQHANGGYGWVGPLYWPFAYDDFYDYALWGPPYAAPFWGYGYNDIYAGIFGPYGYDTMTGYFPRYASAFPAPRRGRSRAVEPADPLAQMCNADAGDIAGVPADQIKQLIQLTADQQSALDALSAVSTKAAGDVRAACPSDMVLTAPARLAVMEQRIDAMISAVQALQMPLQKFYDSLNDEQRERFTALVEQQRQSSRRSRASSMVQVTADCGVMRPGVMDWPDAQIEQRLHPTEAQRAPLAALQAAATKASDMLKSCEPNNATTLPARLAAINDRLNTMLDAVKIVRAALDKFYASLTDEQKAQFEAIGRERMG